MPFATALGDTSHALLTLLPVVTRGRYYLLMGTLAGHTKQLAPQIQLGASATSNAATAGHATATAPSRADLVRANLAHHALRRAERLADEFLDTFLHQCRRTARNMRLDVPLAGNAVDVRRALRGLLEVGHYRECATPLIPPLVTRGVPSSP